MADISLHCGGAGTAIRPLARGFGSPAADGVFFSVDASHVIFRFLKHFSC